MFSFKSLMKTPSRSGPRQGQVAVSRHHPLGDVRPLIRTIWVIQPPTAIHLPLHAISAPPHLQVLLTRHHQSTANAC